MRPPSPPPAELAALQAALLRWRADPVGWVRKFLRAEPDPWQAAALQALVTHDRLAVRSGHGVGKSTFLAWAILWFMCNHGPCKVPVTGSNFDQLKATLWSEVATWLERLPEPLRREWVFLAEGLESKHHPEQLFAALRTASKERAQNLAGFHSKWVLVVVDEASAVDDAVFEVLDGALSTKGSRILMTGNPTQRSGRFYRAFHDLRDRHWTMHVNAASSPRVSPEWVESQKALYGEHSNAYRVRVLGEFPSQDFDGVIPLDLVEAAVGRDVAALDVPPRWGVDVAGAGEGGDRCALAKRQGNVLLEPVKSWQGIDTEQFTGIIVREWMDTPVHMRPERVCIDGIGIGTSVADKLKHTPVPGLGVMVSARPAQSDRFEKLRDELWWKGREWFAAYDCRIPNDQALIAELTAPKYQERPSGKIKVEGKTELRARGLRSPDCFIAGTLVLTPSGYRRIEQIEVGDEVVTPWAVRRVIRTWMTTTDELTTATFSDGSVLAGKGKHEIFTWNAGFVRLDALSLVSEIETAEPRRLIAWRLAALWNIGGTGSTFSQLVGTIRMGIRASRNAYCTVASGLTTTGRSRLGCMFIISMAIGRITGSRTWASSSRPSTPANTWPNVWRIQSSALGFLRGLKQRVMRLATGIAPKLALSGIGSTVETHGLGGSPLCAYAVGAVSSSRACGGPSTAQALAGRQPPIAPTRHPSASAPSAARGSSPTSTGRRGTVPVSVRTVRVGAPVSVFNLTLDDDNVYYANGVLVRNCADAFLMTFAGPMQMSRLRNQRFASHMRTFANASDAPAYSDLDAP